MGYSSRDLTLVQLQQQTREWTDRAFPNREPHQALVGIHGEVGELLRSHFRDGDEESVSKEAIVIFLADYCSQMGLDLDEAIDEAWALIERGKP